MKSNSVDWYKQIGAVAIILAVVIGILTRIVAPLVSYTQFQGDQIRDAFVYQEMQEGHWVTLGPSSSVGGYQLLPLYYYSVFPFTLLSDDPVVQVIPNALFSFASIILLMLFLYRLHLSASHSIRLCIAGVGGLWWSLLFQEILLNGKEWNVGPVIAVLLAWYLLFASLLNAQIRNAKHYAGWVLFGLLTGYLVSLHSSTLFAVPVLFIVVNSWYWRTQKTVKGPLLASLFAILSLFPYWFGEMQRGFTNTVAIVRTMASSAAESHGALERIDHVLASFFELGPLVYSIDLPVTNIFTALFVLAVVWCVARRSTLNKSLSIPLSITALLFALSIMNYWSMQFVHYKLLILTLPIIVITALFAFTHTLQKPQRLITHTLLTTCILFSLLANGQHIFWYIDNAFFGARLLNTRDVEKIFTNLPVGATVCDSEESNRYLYSYIAEHVVQNEIHISDSCVPGSYRIEQKYERYNDYKPIQKRTFSTDGVIVQEAEIYAVYQL